MPGFETLLKYLKSGTALATAAGGVLGTGAYVTYKDATRFPRMEHMYARGNILSPLACNAYEVTYFPRPEEERLIRHVMQPSFSNEYYLVMGEVGSGKTRLLLDQVRHMMAAAAETNGGAPIYVLASQGNTFPEALASAVDFHFDEHINFSFFLAFMFRVHSFPGRDDKNRLTRVLNAIEKSAFTYQQKRGKPVVLVLDGMNSLTKSMPGALEKIQQKAKLWADTNIVKVIFVSNSEDTELLLQADTSDWSRAGKPINVGDLSPEQAVSFLVETRHTPTPDGSRSSQEPGTTSEEPSMSVERARDVVDLVGGRIQHLISFKRDLLHGIPLEKTVDDLKQMEREKFVDLARCPSMWQVTKAIYSSPNKTVPMETLMECTCHKDVDALLHHNIIILQRTSTGIMAKFASKLTEAVVGEFSRK